MSLTNKVFQIQILSNSGLLNNSFVVATIPSDASSEININFIANGSAPQDGKCVIGQDIEETILNLQDAINNNATLSGIYFTSLISFDTLQIILRDTYNLAAELTILFENLSSRGDLQIIDAPLFGLKYELCFSDIDEHSKKLQILEKNYVNTTREIIGTANPVSIRYEETKEEYTPVLPSTATVNLIETDDVSYENFYVLGEKQFKVVLWYKDTFSVWRQYWQGFIIPDTYFQPIKTKPFNVSFKAVCGLSLLKGVSHTFPHGEYYTSKQYVQHCIAFSNIDLLNESTQDSQLEVVSSGLEMLSDTKIISNLFFDSNQQRINCYDILTFILSPINCRIQQSPSLESDVSIYTRYDLVNYGTHEASANSLSLSNDLVVLDSDLIKSNKGAVSLIRNVYDISYNVGLINNAFQDSSTRGWVELGTGTIEYERVTKSNASYNGNGSGASFFRIDSPTVYTNVKETSKLTLSFDYLTTDDSARFSIAGYFHDNGLLVDVFWDIDRQRWDIAYLNYALEDTKGNFSSRSVSVELNYGFDFEYFRVEFLGNINVDTIFDNVKFTPDYVVDGLGVYESNYKKKTELCIPESINGSRVLEYDKNKMISSESPFVDSKFCTSNTFDVPSSGGVVFVKRKGYAESKTIEQITLTQRLNDTAQESSFYEGSFKKKGKVPVAINDCLLVDYSSFSESRKILITSMSWDVKQGVYNFNGYLAYNSTTDVVNNITTNYD